MKNDRKSMPNLIQDRDFWDDEKLFTKIVSPSPDLEVIEPYQPFDRNGQKHDSGRNGKKK